LLAAEERLALTKRCAKAHEATKAAVARRGKRRETAPTHGNLLDVSAATSAPGRAKKRQPKPQPLEPVAAIRPVEAEARQPIASPQDFETPATTTASSLESDVPFPETST
jgi:hypothetical protein